MALPCLTVGTASSTFLLWEGDLHSKGRCATNRLRLPLVTMKFTMVPAGHVQLHHGPEF